LIIPKINQRVTETVDFTSGRLGIWNAYKEMLLSNIIMLFIGSGVDNAKTLLLPYYGKAQVAHNVFIELIADYGIIGTILLFNMFKDRFAIFVRNTANYKVIFFIMFIITAMSLSLSSYDTICFVIPLLCLISDDLPGVVDV
jgi:O-antigen ligase